MWRIHLEIHFRYFTCLLDGGLIKNYYSVFWILGNVIYVKKVLDVNSSPGYELKEVLKYYIERLKLWISENKFASGGSYYKNDRKCTN